MSNDDIVMANYSMLLEVYFLFMDINLSLSGISLALLCGRRDLKEETYCSNVKEWEYRHQTDSLFYFFFFKPPVKKQRDVLFKFAFI